MSRMCRSVHKRHGSRILMRLVIGDFLIQNATSTTSSQATKKSSPTICQVYAIIEIRRMRLTPHAKWSQISRDLLLSLSAIHFDFKPLLFSFRLHDSNTISVEYAQCKERQELESERLTKEAREYQQMHALTRRHARTRAHGQAMHMRECELRRNEE